MIATGYLLDTVFVSEFIKDMPDPNVVAWARMYDGSSSFISVVTLGEIQKGVSRLRDSTKRERLQLWLTDDLVRRFNGRTLSVDNAIALTWGALQGEAMSSGSTLPIIDSLIAATASVHNLTVVTRNARDMQRCGVPVVNPWQLSAS